MKNLVTLITLSFTIFTHSQKGNTNLRSGQMHNYHPILSGTVNNHLGLEKNIKGSRFVFNKIRESGKIYTKGKTYISQGINIDILNKDLVIQIEKDSILVLEKSKIDSIQIGHHRFKKFHDNLFYEILWENSGNFLIKEYNGYIKKGKLM